MRLLDDVKSSRRRCVFCQGFVILVSVFIDRCGVLYPIWPHTFVFLLPHAGITTVMGAVMTGNDPVRLSYRSEALHFPCIHPGSSHSLSTFVSDDGDGIHGKWLSVRSGLFSSSIVWCSSGYLTSPLLFYPSTVMICFGTRRCTLVAKSSCKSFETLPKAFDSCMHPSRQSFIAISRRRISSLILDSVPRLLTLVWLEGPSRGCKVHPTGKQLRDCPH